MPPTAVPVQSSPRGGLHRTHHGQLPHRDLHLLPHRARRRSRQAGSGMPEAATLCIPQLAARHTTVALRIAVDL